MATAPRSFLPVAAHSHFPLANLPYGVFRPRFAQEPRKWAAEGSRVGCAIGDYVLDLAALEAEGAFGDTAVYGVDGCFSQVTAACCLPTRSDTCRDPAALNDQRCSP